jgi:hypothetical protein
MAQLATFLGPGGQDPITVAHNLELAFVPTQGDILLAGQILRSRIVQRTQNGVDVNGAPFAAYSTNGPYYFYPDRDVAGAKSRAERLTTVGNRFRETGKQGVRTTVAVKGKDKRRAGVGIRYDSYAAAKSAHGRSNVDLFGMVQHPHMMNAMIVKAGGSELDMSADLVAGIGDMDAFSQHEPCSQMHVGFYGEEAERARSHNEGTKHLPRRHFFDASPEDLQIMTTAMANRMLARAATVTK